MTPGAAMAEETCETFVEFGEPIVWQPGTSAALEVAGIVDTPTRHADEFEADDAALLVTVSRALLPDVAPDDRVRVESRATTYRVLTYDTDGQAPDVVMMRLAEL